MATRELGVELIVGCRQDARFGPVVLVGLGGVFTEILRDVAVALAPVDQAGARRLLERLRGAPFSRGLVAGRRSHWPPRRKWRPPCPTSPPGIPRSPKWS